jgi:hypothetical protein
MTYTIAYNLTEFSTGIYLPTAYIVALDDAKILTYRQKIATEDNLKEYQLVFTPTVKKLFDCIALIAPKNLEKKYNANPKKMLSLINLLNDNTIKDKIIEFIHRHLGDFLQTIMQEQLPICLDLLSKQIVHLTQLKLNNTVLHPDIYFEKTTEGLIYRLRIKENNFTWLIQQKACLLICNEPAWIIKDNQLYRIEGINSGRLKPFATKDELFIAQNKLKEYCQKIILPLVEKIDFEHRGFDIMPYNTLIKGDLSLKYNFITHNYSIALSFDYGKMFFPWKDARSQRSFLEINTEGSLLIHHVKRNVQNELILMAL